MKAIGKSETRKGTKEAGQVRIRRKVDPLSPPTTLELRGIRIHFPFKPYVCQEAYMEKVLDALFRSENALLESPTGTGKTLMLLCATLAWQRQQQRSLREAADLPTSSEQADDNAMLGTQDGPAQAARLPQIIYASRTHSQLSQVVRELRNTRYRPTHAVLASREQMCVNPKVKKVHSTASDINHDCSKLGKERKCRYRNGLEGFVPPPSEHGGGSPNHQPVMDLEEMVDMGKTHHVCPFYYTRSHVENAELILVPYNYLFDKDARETTLSDVRWQNAVVIFDEAHNLESFASDAASFDLSNVDIAGCMNEVQRAANYLSSMPDLQYNIKEDNLALLTRAFEGLENFILGLGPQTAYSGEFMMEIFRKGAGITHSNHGLFIEELRKVNDMIMDLRGTGATRGSPRLEHFVTCLKRVFGHKHEARCLAKASSYRVHVSPKVNGEAKTGRTVSYWCFAPSVAMEELANLNVRSIIVTSGTLSPLPSYSLELGIPFPHTLENPHIIQGDQVHVRVIGKGVSGKSLSSSYERRQDGEYYSELGSTLASLAKVVPAGMLVFFPSYGVMETCIERWGGPSMSRPSKPQGRNAFFAQRKKANTSKQYAFPRIAPAYNTTAFGNSASSPWRRMLCAKAVVVEPRSSADLPDAISEFKRFLEMHKSSGCILMGVCRGKISEGIDFAHDMSRAVIITGIPFAPAFDAKVKMKREFLDCARTASANKPAADAGFANYNDVHKCEGGVVSSKLSGSDWYLQQAHRAVNQAVGRVIRNKSDYGAILLLDTRFDQPRNTEGLSRWVRPYVQRDEGFGAAVKALGAFYRGASTQARIRTESRPAPVDTEVNYDEGNLSDEDSIGNVKNVAIIMNEQPPGNIPADDIESIGDAYVAPNRVVARVSVNAFSVQSGTKIAVQKMSQKLGVAHNFDGVFKRSGTTTVKKTKTAASIFMEKTRTLMDVNEQSTIRKLIVIMKKQGDKKDIRGFRQSASGIIDLVLRTEKHDSPPVESDERMLFLFLDLVPQAYRNDFELIALQKVIEMSVLGQQCKENLLPAECTRLFSATVTTLQLVWFRKDEQDIAFIQNAERVISAMCKTEKVVSQTMLRSYLSLLPRNRHEICRRLFEEIESKRRMEQQKEQQRQQVGEASIDMNRFLPATLVNKRSFGRLDSAKSEEFVRARGPAAPANAPSAVPSEYRKVPVNPYKKMKTKVESSKAASNSAGSSRTTSLSSILESIESDPSVYHKKPSTNSTGTVIKSNAPSNLTCLMCSTRMTQPYIAPCGHLACLGCWKDWLGRSQTCAACRAPTVMDSISLAVYQTTTKAGVSSDKLNQPPEQKKVSNIKDDSDGELELY